MNIQRETQQHFFRYNAQGISLRENNGNTLMDTPHILMVKLPDGDDWVVTAHSEGVL